MQFLPIIVAGLIPMALGIIWYHKSVFGQAWMDSIGMTEEKAASGNMGLRMGLAALLSIVLAFILKGFLWATHDYGAPVEGIDLAVQNMTEAGQMDFMHGSFHGMFIGLMIAMPVLVNNGLFEQKSPKNLLINSGYWIVAISLMTGLLNAWHIAA